MAGAAPRRDRRGGPPGRAFHPVVHPRRAPQTDTSAATVFVLLLLGCGAFGPHAPSCPEGTAPMPKEQPALCVDIYENSFVDGVPWSKPGVEPAVGMTFDAAVEACARRRYRDAAGNELAQARLPTAAEWEDAADGTVGPGGLAYPYGPAPVDGACNIPRDHQGPPHPSPTGSFPACKSPFGTFDQIGNVWEWTDSGERIDIQGFLAARKGQGLELDLDADGHLHVAHGVVNGLQLAVAGLPMARVVQDDAGVVVARLAGVAGGMKIPSGFLFAPGAAGSARTLPVEVAPIPGDAEHWAIVVRTRDDGAPLPDKRGCAHYAGDPIMCKGSTASLLHPHDFSGSIGFRCVVAPFVQ